MNLPALIDRMETFPRILDSLVAGIPDEDLRWRPDPEAWSILDILDHIHLEELQDFRPRLESTLEDPQRAWPPLDPPAALDERRARPHDVRDTLDAFRDARADSVRWLRTLGEEPWTNTYAHPVIGPLRAGDLLASWAAHDALHLRQLAHRRLQLADRDTADFSPAYAGDW